MKEFNGMLRMPGICGICLYIKKCIAVRNIYNEDKRWVGRVFNMSGAAARTGDLNKQHE